MILPVVITHCWINFSQSRDYSLPRIISQVTGDEMTHCQILHFHPAGCTKTSLFLQRWELGYWCIKWRHYALQGVVNSQNLGKVPKNTLLDLGGPWVEFHFIIVSILIFHEKWRTNILVFNVYFRRCKHLQWSVQEKVPKNNFGQHLLSFRLLTKFAPPPRPISLDLDLLEIGAVDM